MATTLARPWSVPTRDALHGLSRWVWLLLLIAGLVALVRVVSGSGVTLDDIPGAVLSASPLIAAAALMAIAPGERLVALSAFGFAAGPTLRTVQAMFSTDLHDLLRMSLPAYLDLANGVQAVVGAFRGIYWLFELIAVLSLAFYIGTVRSQRGWWIVGIGVVLAALHVISNLITLLPIWSSIGDVPGAGFDQAQALASAVLGTLILVAWAYLWAVAVDRRLYLIALAGAVWFVQNAFGLASFAAIQAFPPDQSPTNIDTFNLASFWIGSLFGVVFWGLLILGILRELPGERAHPVDSPGPPEADATAG